MAALTPEQYLACVAAMAGEDAVAAGGQGLETMALDWGSHHGGLSVRTAARYADSVQGAPAQ